MVRIPNFTTQFTFVRPIHKCEILTLQSDFSVCWTKMSTDEVTFHTPLTKIYWTTVQTIQYS